jgi:cation diffusion facilitator family transporter
MSEVLPHSAVSERHENDLQKTYRDTPLNLKKVNEEKENLSWSSMTRAFMRTLSVDRNARRVALVCFLLFLVACAEMHFAYHGDSLALLATAHYTLFDVLALIVSLVALTVTKQRPSLVYSYGYDRIEVLLGFAAGTYLIFVSLYVFFEAFERLLEPPRVHAGHIFGVVWLGFVAHLATVLLFGDRLYFRSESAISFVPRTVETVSKQALWDTSNHLLLLLESFLLFIREWFWLDSFVSWLIVVHAFTVAYPVCYNAGRILLQAVPRTTQHILDECLRDAMTIDGVMEIRREKSHFWTYAPGVYVGSIHVRIKQDANAQWVQHQLTRLFSPYLHYFTVQLTRDDWTRVDLQNHTDFIPLSSVSESHNSTATTSISAPSL